jgi:hypothetical protein
VGIDPVSLAISVALTAASMAVTAMQTIEGPRLSDLTVTVADYGTVLNYVYGRRRLTGPVFYAEPIREVHTEEKTKGGKYQNYKYYGTFAICVADHEIDEYHKLWFDHHLVFDSADSRVEEFDGTISSMMEFAAEAMLHKGKAGGMPGRLYYGTETQTADPRMVAIVEAEEGPGTCPAYLGVAYIFFEELPLENFGNRLPQVEFEVMGLTKSMIAALELVDIYG